MNFINLERIDIAVLLETRIKNYLFNKRGKIITEGYSVITDVCTNSFSPKQDISFSENKMGTNRIAHPGIALIISNSHKIKEIIEPHFIGNDPQLCEFIFNKFVIIND